MPVDWSEFASVIQTHSSFILTSHIRPDCDALGSELGMAGVLEALGKRVVIVNGDVIPPNLAFIDPDRKIRTINQNITMAELESFEVLMILDTSAWAQLGPMGEVIRATRTRKILLDHHVGEDDLGAQLFKDTKAEATGRLVIEAAEKLGVALTPAIATPLFAAVATDTGWFRFASTSSQTFRAGAKLMEAGAQPAVIFRDLYEQDTLPRMRLRGVILTHIRSELDGRLAHTYARQTDFDETGALPSDTEDVINSLLAIAGTEVAAIFVEQRQGGFKISLRSRSKLDCAAVTGQFGGGGHKAAAGATIKGEFDDVRTRVLDAVRAAMR